MQAYVNPNPKSKGIDMTKLQQAFSALKKTQEKK